MSKKRPISKQLDPVTDIVKMREVVSGIHGLDDAINALGSSNRLMGRAMGEYRNDKRFYSASTISHWRHPRAGWSFKMHSEHLNQAGLVLNDWVQHELGRADVRFQMRVNSPWRCWVEVQRECGHWEKFDMRRANAKHCKGCAK